MKTVLFYTLIGLALALVFLGDALATTSYWWFGLTMVIFGFVISASCLVSNYREKKKMRKTK